MVPLSSQEIQKKVGMRPTLLVGIGGTGQKVLVQLKARFLRNYGVIPSDVRFLCFDTDQTAEKTQVDGKVVTLTTDTELINVGGIEPNNILFNLDRHPAVAAWITEDKENIPARAIVMGARQVRPLGRLSLFWRIETLYNKISEAVGNLTKLEETPNDQRGVNVFVISSVCGGTGSGAILDVAYLARHAIDRAGLTSAFCFINGILALPSVFPNVEKIGIEANAYATLEELDYFMNSGEWHVDYGNTRVGTVEFKGQPPFNICYLVGARNEQGQGLNGMEEIGPMIAEAVYLQISSQVGRATDSVFDNVDVLTGHVEDRETGKMKPTAYSSFGTASLVFPALKVIEICSHRLGVELIGKSLLHKDESEDAEKAAVKNFLQVSQLEAETLLKEVSRDAKGNAIKIVADPRNLDRFKENELLQATQGYMRQLENTLDNEYNQALEANRKSLSDVLAKRLDTEVNRLVDDANCGLYFTVSFLQELDRVLALARKDMDKAREAMDARRDRAFGSLRQLMDAFSSSFRSSIFGKSGRIKDTRNRYIAAYQDYLNARFEGRKHEVAVAVVASLTSIIQTRRSSIQNLIDRLQFIQNQYDTFGEKGGTKSRVEYVLAQEITNFDDVDMFYKNHWDQLGASPVTLLLEAQGPLHTWLDMDQNTVSDKVLQYARGLFDDIRQITIENETIRKRAEVEPDKRMQDLINRSVPFWNYKKETLGQDWRSKKILVKGVRDRESSIYVSFSSGQEGTEETLISTFDPHTITVLQTKHGLPLFGLTQYKDYKAAHDQVMKNKSKPLYVFPEVRPGGEKAKQIFALALAYGYVFKSGVYYNVVPKDPGYPPIRLDQGMSDSLRSFRSNDDLIAQVTHQLEDQVSREGRETASQMLNEWIREPYVYELKGGATKVTGSAVDRTAMSKDNSVSRPGGVNYYLVMELRETVKKYMTMVLLA